MRVFSQQALSLWPWMAWASLAIVGSAMQTKRNAMAKVKEVFAAFRFNSIAEVLS